MTSIFQILMLLLNIVYFIVIAHVIMSWLINFQVLNLRQPLVAQIWEGLNRILDPIYTRVRSVLPQMGGLDLAPLVVLIGVAIARIVLMNNAAIREDTEGKMKRFDVRPPNPKLSAKNFSGGNQQKIVLAREIERNPDLLLVGQPTRGVDIGAIEFIHQ